MAASERKAFLLRRVGVEARHAVDRLQRLRFWSQRDEESFEGWCARTPCMTQREWVGEEYRLTIRRRRIAQRDLERDDFSFARHPALARMDQLAQFLDTANRRWFADPGKLYRRRVFPAGVSLAE